MGNPDKERFPGRDSRAHDPSTKDRVVCEDLYVRIGTRGAGRAELRRTARDTSKNAVCETLLRRRPRERSTEKNRSKERITGEGVRQRDSRGGSSARYRATLILEIQLEITRMDEPVSGRRTGLKAC